MLSEERALKKAADMCVRREYCAFDIRQKLFRMGLSKVQSERIIRQLKEEQFIDENRYAEFYVKDKFRLNGWGKIKIRYMLRAKQVADSIIDRFLSQIPDSEYAEKCRELAERKAVGLKGDKPHENKQKLLRFMSSRGFETDLILRYIDELFEHD